MAVLVPTVSLGQLQASCGHSVVPCPCSSWLRWTGHGSQSIRRPPQIPALGFCQELLLAQREPDRTWESSSHILLANLLWRGYPMTVRQWKAPGKRPDVLLAALEHCRAPPGEAQAQGCPCHLRPLQLLHPGPSLHCSVRDPIPYSTEAPLSFGSLSHASSQESCPGMR